MANSTGDMIRRKKEAHMAKKMTLTPKDVLYMEDIVNAAMLIYKKIQLEMEQLQDENNQNFLSDICSDLKDQANRLTEIMEGAKS